jgi:hypothetical protein
MNDNAVCTGGELIYPSLGAGFCIAYGGRTPTCWYEFFYAF